MAERTPTKPAERGIRDRRGMALRVSALCGALAVVVGALGSALGDVTAEGVSPSSSTGVLIATYVQYHHRLQLGASLSLLAFVLQLVFLGPLWARLRTGSEQLAVVAILGGAASAAALWLLTAAVYTAMGSAAAFGDGSAAQMLLLMAWDTSRIATAPNAVMIGACVVAGLRFRTFPRWFTLVSVVLAALSIALMLPSGPAGGAAALGGLWVLIASIYLTMAPRREEHGPSPDDRPEPGKLGPDAAGLPANHRAF